MKSQPVRFGQLDGRMKKWLSSMWTAAITPDYEKPLSIPNVIYGPQRGEKENKRFSLDRIQI